MRMLRSPIVRWVSLGLGVATLGLFGGPAPAAAASGGSHDLVLAAAGAPSERWSGVVLAVFVAAALLVALWRVVLRLLAVAVVGVALLGVVVLMAGGPPDGDHHDGAGAPHSTAVVLAERGTSC